MSFCQQFEIIFEIRTIVCSTNLINYFYVNIYNKNSILCCLQAVVVVVVVWFFLAMLTTLLEYRFLYFEDIKRSLFVQQSKLP